MPFTLITGRYFVKGYSPDGDSIRFQADQSGRWSKLPRTVKLNSKGHAQLRLEAIDTPETHFGAPVQHQPLGPANAARDALLKALGITNVTFGKKQVTAANDGTKGFIACRDTDGKGRPVSIAFLGSPPAGNQDAFRLNVATFKKSANFTLARDGLAYPMYYETFYYDLRDAVSAAVVAARTAKRGVWKADKSLAGVTMNKLSAITDTHTIFPKLFRRLVEFWQDKSTVVGFKAWLDKKNEGVFVISRGQATHFDTVVLQNGKKIRMDVPPEDLVFEP
jgi:endonuclease YncB( thermonuclease family)